MNILTFSGNIGKDAELRNAGGSPVLGFSVAMRSGFGNSEQTHWVDCALWGKRAEGGIAQYLTKGKKVFVSGELSTREHNGKTYLQCRVAEIELVGDAGQRQSDGGQRQQSAPAVAHSHATPQPAAAEPDFDDDIPF